MMAITPRHLVVGSFLCLSARYGREVEKTVLEPEFLDCKIHYRIPVENRNKIASPRGTDLVPQFFNKLPRSKLTGYC